MRVQNDVRVTIRVDRDLKENAEALFERLGMNMSTALNVFLRKVVDESAIPFPVSIKNPKISYGLSTKDITDAFTEAVANDVDEKRKRGLPIAKYDAMKKQAYLEFSDGNREYVNE